MTVSVQTICNHYLEVFPQEKEALNALIRQLRQKGEKDITSKDMFDTGHLTAATIIVRLPDRRVLLLEHTIYNRLLQPGGHVDPEDASPVAAAYRECEEEAGIPAHELKYIPLSEQDVQVPFHISVHDILERPERHEPAHHHYDFQYLFTVKDNVTVNLDDREAGNHHWVPFAEFAKYPHFMRQAEKIEKLLTLL